MTRPPAPSDDHDLPQPGNAGVARAPGSREDRLRATLRANLARRKAQARTRAGGDAGMDGMPEGPDAPGADAATPITTARPKAPPED